MCVTWTTRERTGAVMTYVRHACAVTADDVTHARTLVIRAQRSLCDDGVPRRRQHRVRRGVRNSHRKCETCLMYIDTPFSSYYAYSHIFTHYHRFILCSYNFHDLVHGTVSYLNYRIPISMSGNFLVANLCQCSGNTVVWFAMLRIDIFQ